MVPDPANPQSLNRYSFVLANPLKYRDPMGHCAEGENPGECDPDLTLELLNMDPEDLYWYLHNTHSQWEIIGWGATGFFLLTTGGAVFVDLGVPVAEAIASGTGSARKATKAVVEEYLESQMMGRPFDWGNVGLDFFTGYLDDVLTAWKYREGQLCFAGRSQEPQSRPDQRGYQDSEGWKSRQSQRPRRPLDVDEAAQRWGSMDRPEMMQKTMPGATDIGPIPQEKMSAFGRFLVGLGRIITGFLGGGQ